ncbi:MAG TPA: DUF2795 domain-containing protein [Thermomicrobiales bacterium]|nr:DUF2795 domain-containing protein [Thermomicrobiales bacterium]
MAKLNPIELQQALKGVDYPADKIALAEAAERNGASGDVRNAIDRLPDKQYEKPTDVTEAVDFGADSDEN